MPSYNSTARVPFSKGGKVDKKPPKPKRIILWKGKVKDWPGAQKAKERTGKAKGGKVKPWGSGPKPGTHEFLMQTLHKRNKKADGGRIGLKSGTKLTKEQKRKKLSQQVSRDTLAESMDDVRDTKGKVHSIKKGQKDSAKRIDKLIKKQRWFFPEKELKKNFGKVRDKGWSGKHSTKVEHNATGGIIGLKKGGKADKKWIQGVNKSIKKRGTKGVCTGKKFGGPTCRPGTKRYNLAKTFKKMARSKHASGGLVRFI